MKMAFSSTFTIKSVEENHISPSPPPASRSDSDLDSDSDSNSTNNSTLVPLTFFDIPWLLFPPSQPLFFFQLPPHSSHDFFTNTVLPKLKLSFASALHHFLPFAAKLIISDDKLFLDSSYSSLSVPLTVTECDDADFDWFCSHRPRNASHFHQLVPQLVKTLHPNTQDCLLAVQITYFPNALGFSIGLAYHHVVCDQRTFNNFIRSWASFCKFGVFPHGLQPHYDRSMILDPTGLQPILLNQWRDRENKAASLSVSPMVNDEGLVRATFVMGPADIESAKRWILARCDESHRAYPVLLSPYVVTCAFVWASLAKVQQEAEVEIEVVPKGSMYFGFIAGGITRLSYPVPMNYFGNCIAFGRAVAKREELLKEEDGILVAVDVIGKTVKDLDGDVLGGAENWISDWEPILGSDQHMNVVGSPKVELYKTDFGWGMPKKIEEISTDAMKGICVSLVESRDMKGGIEIGMTLPHSTMDAFSSLFTKGLISFHCV